MGKVILLTGAPATGKSTLRRNLTARISNLVDFDYGRLLLNQKSAEGIDISYENLRAHSADVISPSDVSNLDERVIEEISKLRSTSNVVLDSHAVTRESYGFRAVPFSNEQLSRLKLDVVFVLRCDSAALLERMSEDRKGRQVVSLELAQEHQQLQECVGVVYAISCGCPFFVLDTTQLSEEDVLNQALKLLAAFLNH